jgi:hypothetical protein
MSEQFPDFSKARVGDRVWHWQNRWGTIENIDLTIKVRFNQVHWDTYNLSGFRNPSDTRPSIFWQEVPIPPEALVPPKRKVIKYMLLFFDPLKGWIVAGCEMRPRFFKTYEEAEKYSKSMYESYTDPIPVEIEE